MPAKRSRERRFIKEARHKQGLTGDPVSLFKGSLREKTNRNVPSCTKRAIIGNCKEYDQERDG